MKTLILSILTAILLVSCKTSKPTIESPHNPIVVLTSDSIALTATAGDFPILEPDKTIYTETIGEGIGLGSLNTIGHGAVHYEENQIKIIKVDNSMVSAKSTNMGHVVYKIPTEMKVRNTYQVIVRISKTTAQIYENLNGEVRTTTIPITETMEVKLIDPSPEDRKMFDVIADNEAIQLVENDESITQWTWNVTPIRTGKAQLKVVIAVITNGNKKETVYEDVVNVDSNLSKQIPLFFNSYWQWLIATLLIPVFKYLWPILVKRREEKNKVKKKKPSKKA
jgi:hypothetical protein